MAFLGFVLYEKREKEFDFLVLNAISLLGKRKLDIEKPKKID